MTTYTVTIEEDATGDLILPIPPELCEELGWKEGDTISWTDNHDGTYTIAKIKAETEWVMVECVSSQRKRYMVEVPVGKEIWALDTVSMDEAKTFNCTHLGEHIVSHTVMDKETAMALCRKDNAHKSSWTDKQCETVYFTEWEDD